MTVICKHSKRREGDHQTGMRRAIFNSLSFHSCLTFEYDVMGVWICGTRVGSSLPLNIINRRSRNMMIVREGRRWRLEQKRLEMKRRIGEGTTSKKETRIGGRIQSRLDDSARTFTMIITRYYWWCGCSCGVETRGQDEEDGGEETIRLNLIHPYFNIIIMIAPHDEEQQAAGANNKPQNPFFAHLLPHHHVFSSFYNCFANEKKRHHHPIHNEEMLMLMKQQEGSCRFLLPLTSSPPSLLSITSSSPSKWWRREWASEAVVTDPKRERERERSPDGDLHLECWPSKMVVVKWIKERAKKESEKLLLLYFCHIAVPSFLFSFLSSRSSSSSASCLMFTKMPFEARTVF